MKRIMLEKVVSVCYECPFYIKYANVPISTVSGGTTYRVLKVSVCGKSKGDGHSGFKRVDDPIFIPDWCPLDDCEQEEKNDGNE